MIVSQWSQPPVNGVSARLERVRVVRVGVEACARLGHALDPGDGRDAAGGRTGGGDAAGDKRIRVNLVDRGIRRVEQTLDVDRGRRRPQPPPLVRLVPDEPAPHVRVTLRRVACERGEGGPARRRPVRAAPTVRPGGRRVEGQDRLDAAVVQALEHGVVAAPVERAAALLDLAPDEVQAHDVDAQRLQAVEALVERAWAEADPRVVLDPVAHVRRSGSPRRKREHDERCHKDSQQAHLLQRTEGPG